MSSEKAILRFHIIKYWARHTLYERKAYISVSTQVDIKKELNKPGVSDALVLFKMVIKEVDAQNTTIETRRTRLQDLQMKRGWEDSALLKDLAIPHRQVDKLINENPTLDAYQIFKLLIL